MEFQPLSFQTVYNSSLPVTFQFDAIYSVQLKKHHKIAHLLLLLLSSSSLLVGWDFWYCGHYWPIVPTPDDR
jgi:hypothetical protein